MGFWLIWIVAAQLRQRAILSLPNLGKDLNLRRSAGLVGYDRFVARYEF